MFSMAVSPDWSLITTIASVQLLLVWDIYSSNKSVGAEDKGRSVAVEDVGLKANKLITAIIF